MQRTIGTCSLCGGAVTVPEVWMVVVPPTPTCSGCGAHPAAHGRVIEMLPTKPAEVTFATSLAEVSAPDVFGRFPVRG